MSTREIVVGLDDSGSARAALRWASDHARHTGLVLRAVNARLLGGDTILDGNIGADGTLRLSAQGTATAEALRDFWATDADLQMAMIGPVEGTLWPKTLLTQPEAAACH